MSSDKHQLGVGHRLKVHPTRAMGAAMNSELAYAHYVADGLSCADMAHCLMLAEESIIPRDAAKGILEALLELHELGEDAWTGGLTEGDVYDHRDAWLKNKLGSLSGWLHTARARREAINLGWLMGLRADTEGLAERVHHTVDAILVQSEHHAETVMPDFTYLQHAHPTTLGHYLLGFAYPLMRDAQRLEEAGRVLLASPAGSVSTNGSRLPVNRKRVSQLLGFSSEVEHNRDAMWQPDLAINLMAVVTSLQTTIDRLVEELFLWCTQEFGFLELSDAHCRTSVIMPQKKNPYSLAHLRGKARAMPGKLLTVITTNLTPSGQVDNRVAAYELVPEALRTTSESLALLAEIITQSTFNTGRMAAAARHGFAWATELVEWLVETEKMDARAAHSVVGAMVAQLKEDSSAQDCAAAFRASHPTWAGDEVALLSIFDERRIALSRTTPGSCGPQEVMRMVLDLKNRLVTGRARLAAESQQRHQARQSLMGDATHFLRT